MKFGEADGFDDSSPIELTHFPNSACLAFKMQYYLSIAKIFLLIHFSCITFEVIMCFPSEG